ncbi:MAG: hypothetical protein WCX61_02400 [Candidatus Peribacteraceae bacterium]|jgi:hypothetical protein
MLSISPSTISLRLTFAIAALLRPCQKVLASVYTGDGVQAGVAAAADTGVSTGTDLKAVIGDIVNEVLTYVSLLAVAVIIIAGLYLIVGVGSDSSKETAKKIVLYVAAGLIVILLSKTFVELIKTIGGSGGGITP